MTIRAVAAFDVTGWDQVQYEEEVEGPQLSRATVRKRFRGDLTGESTAELLMCQADPSDFSSGAGYVASERFVGRLGDRAGTFVVQHWGLSGGGLSPRTAGHVVPGSGTGELTGLSGEVEISVDADGGHSLSLDYDI
jgi:Protein of unknown function (DUF3224)